MSCLVSRIPVEVNGVLAIDVEFDSSATEISSNLNSFVPVLNLVPPGPPLGIKKFPAT